MNPLWNPANFGWPEFTYFFLAILSLVHYGCCVFSSKLIAYGLSGLFATIGCFFMLYYGGFFV